MKANGSTMLLLRDYVGTRRCREQSIKTFAMTSKRIHTTWRRVDRN
jgi:hypothetical protein